MNFPLKTILIDDETLAISRLKRLLANFSDTFVIIGEAGNGAEGLLLIERERHDLIFLDIEMPLLNGFEMLSRLTYAPMVVFATAFDQYAIRAFEEHSVDYLLKPIEVERMERTARKIRLLAEQKLPSPTPEPASAGVFPDNLMRLLEQMQPKKELHAVSVKTGDKIKLVPLTDIAYFEAEDKYVFLCTMNGQKFLTTYTIATLADRLPDTFARVSRATLINTHKISEIHKHFDGKHQLILTDKKATRIVTGSSYGDAVKRLLEL